MVRIGKREGGGLLTKEDARAAGLAFEEPSETSCEFCGRRLEPLGAAFQGRVMWVAHEPCGCEGEQARSEEEERRRRAEEEAEMARKVASSGIGKRFRDARTSIPAAISFLESFGENRGRGLYIRGGTGAGKTTAACAVARALIYSGYRVRVTTTLAMLDAIRDGYDSGARGASAIGTWTCCDLLVLDDLGKENANSWAMTTLFQVVNERYEAMLPTIFTSQYRIEEIERRMSRSGEQETAAAIASRIRETCDSVDIGNRDRR
ncbi:MAG: ATP-binding protein, partial [Eggerthellaceae bacterium]|nr:ATP-binding protein [Eggerthellaceae bacterium]